jgi:XTP/dITP diphosphohydrolase
MNDTRYDEIVVVLATNNRDKIREIKPLLESLGHGITVRSLDDLQSAFEIEETEETLEGNARLKSEAVFSRIESRFPYLVTFADDTGLEVAGIGGAPGVYSARYAPMPEGQSPTYEDNIRHLLKEMEHVGDRKAVFRTVIALKGRIPGKSGPAGLDITVEGSVEGEITREKAGGHGFGYDPVFLIPELQTTFAQMGMEEKNRLSHRSIAVRKAAEALRRRLAQDG